MREKCESALEKFSPVRKQVQKKCESSPPFSHTNQLTIFLLSTHRYQTTHAAVLLNTIHTCSHIAALEQVRRASDQDNETVVARLLTLGCKKIISSHIATKLTKKKTKGAVERILSGVHTHYNSLHTEYRSCT